MILIHTILLNTRPSYRANGRVEEQDTCQEENPSVRRRRQKKVYRSKSESTHVWEGESSHAREPRAGRCFIDGGGVMDRCDIIALRRSTANRIRVQGAGCKVQPPLRATSCIKGAEMIRSVRFICTCSLSPPPNPTSFFIRRKRILWKKIVFYWNSSFSIVLSSSILSIVGIVRYDYRD